MSDSQQIKAVNHLLTNVSNDIANNHSLLVDWLRHNYRNGENWYKLFGIQQGKDFEIGLEVSIMVI